MDFWANVSQCGTKPVTYAPVADTPESADFGYFARFAAFS
jgi:hypothetical protein